jgi:hypothetical protein
MKAPAAWHTRSSATKLAYEILFNFCVTTKTKEYTMKYSYNAVK